MLFTAMAEKASCRLVMGVACLYSSIKKVNQ
jgi:hypothetical protein